MSDADHRSKLAQLLEPLHNGIELTQDSYTADFFVFMNCHRIAVPLEMLTAATETNALSMFLGANP